MTESNGMPLRLYKYRNFDNRVIDMLVSDVIYFSDPSKFNDPLDTKPVLSTDLCAAELEGILRRLFEKRINDEISAAARTIRSRDRLTRDDINRVLSEETETLLAEIRYYATDPDYQAADPHRFLLGQYVQKELLRRYDRGVFSLAERADCPLMWSHYGDQHCGICLGYSIPAGAESDLHKIEYGGSRFIVASKVAAMLDGDATARQMVDDAVLLRKACNWRYEREWRLFGPKGRQDSPLELEEVVFGMRCSAPVKHAVTKALEGRDRPVEFYEICETPGQFILDKRILDSSEMDGGYGFPRRALSRFDGFQDPP